MKPIPTPIPTPIQYILSKSKMLIPIRCFTCGRITGNKWEIFKKKREEGKPDIEIFKEMNVKSYCCKRMLLGHVDLIIDILQYSDAVPIEE